jgi:hypothetical protein
VTLGALNLLSITRAPMEEADVIVARAFADLATLSIVQHRASAEAQRLNEQLAGALTSRVVIEQAKGVISERAGIDLAEAFSRLRGYARSSNLRECGPSSSGRQLLDRSASRPKPWSQALYGTRGQGLRRRTNAGRRVSGARRACLRLAHALACCRFRLAWYRRINRAWTSYASAPTAWAVQLDQRLPCSRWSANRCEQRFVLPT